MSGIRVSTVETGCKCFRDCFTCPFDDCIVDLPVKDQHVIIEAKLGIRPQKDDDLTEMIKLAASGYSSGEISEKMGNVSSWTVCYKLRKAGFGRACRNTQMQLF
jgi:hypothetical protein